MKSSSMFFGIIGILSTFLSCTSEPSIESLDKTPPYLTITSPTNGQEVGATFQISGTVSDDKSGIKNVYVKIDNNGYIPAVLSANNWNISLTSLTDGWHTNLIYAEDNQENKSTVFTLIIHVNTIPNIDIISPKNHCSTNITNIQLSGISSVFLPDTITKVQIKINNGLWENTINTVSWTKTIALPEKTNSIFVKAITTLGKTNVISNWVLYNDNIRPTLTINCPMGNISLVSNHFTVSGISSDSYLTKSVYISINGGIYKRISESSSWNTNLIFLWFSTNSIKVFSIDKSGNYSLTNQRIFYLKNKICSSDGASGDYFGGFVDCSANGKIAIIGAYSDNSSQGSAYIYKWNETNWIETKITASDGLSGNEFGCSVSINSDGTIVVIGARYGNSNKGAAYIYKWNGSSWIETKITASDGSSGDLFGFSTAISGDGNVVIIGAREDNSGQGAAYIYKWNGSSWVQTKLTASDGLANNFGQSVSLSYSGNYCVVGSWKAKIGLNTAQGAIYYYKWNGSSWEETKIYDSDGSSYDSLGISVDISSDGLTILTGAFYDDINNVTNQGSAYIYKWNGSSWVQTKLTALDGSEGDQFGNSVSISSNGTSLIIGASLESNYSGSAYIYKWNGSSWVQTKLTASDGADSDFYGIGVSISAIGQHVIIGSGSDDIGANANQGSAWIYGL